MVAERIEPLTKTKYRKRLTKSNKYLMFDLGVRRLAAHEGDKQPLEVKGRLFEQMIGLELLRIAAQLNQHAKLYFWRDLNGPEVDWVIAINGQYIPIEVKLTDNPRSNDIKHLETFLDEYDNATKAYVICCTPRALTCSDRVDALPWFDLPKVFEA
jgi:predicted AAA+ superfamily ATPase